MEQQRWQFAYEHGKVLERGTFKECCLQLSRHSSLKSATDIFMTRTHKTSFCFLPTILVFIVKKLLSHYFH